MAERVADAEGASLRHDGATQLHGERRNAAGRECETAGTEIDFHGVLLDWDAHNDEHAFLGLSPGARWIALSHSGGNTSSMTRPLND